MKRRRKNKNKITKHMRKFPSLYKPPTSESKADINSMPDLVLLEIFKHSDWKELLLVLRAVNKKWYRICQDTSLWKTQGIYPRKALSGEQLLSFVHYAPGVGELDLQKSTSISQDSLLQMLEITKNLQYLILPERSEITTAVLQCMVKYCPKITTLKFIRAKLDSLKPDDYTLFCRLPNFNKIELYACSGISDGDFKTIIEGCRKLTSIRWDSCPSISGQTVQSVANSGLQLETLWIGDTENVTVADYTQIAKLPSLVELGLMHSSSYTYVNSTVLKIISENCKHIGKLNLAINHQEEGFEHLAQNLSESLEELGWTYSRIYDEDLKHFADHCKKLKKVVIIGCEDITDDGIRYFINSLHETLTRIVVDFTRVTLGTIRGLRMRYGKKIKIDYCNC